MLYAPKSSALVGILLAAAALANPLVSRSGCKHQKVEEGYAWRLDLYGRTNCNEAAPGVMPSNTFLEQPCMHLRGTLHKAESFVLSVASHDTYVERNTFILNFYEEAGWDVDHMAVGPTIRRGAAMLSPVDAFYKKHFKGKMPKSFQVMEKDKSL